MTVDITPQIIFSAIETLTLDAASSVPVTLSGFNRTTGTLNSASTPAVTKASYDTFTLSGGAVTIDLTSLTGINGAAVDATGLRVQTMIVSNPSGNADMTIVIGATNGYDGFGSAFSLELAGGSSVGIVTNDNGSDISSTKKTLDISGTGTETINIGFTFG